MTLDCNSLVDRRIIALIPARSGSKGLPDKNIMNYKGAPLMVHSIKQGIASKYIDDVIVSTDSELYRNIAINNGAKAPYLRPEEISGDLSTDYDFFIYHLNWLRSNNEILPDYIVLLRPTYPTRKISDIDKAIELFDRNYDDIDSLKSIIRTSLSPYKMWLNSNGLIEPLLTLEGENEPFNLPRQLLPVVYWQNACIDIVKTSVIMQQHSVTGARVMPYIMNESETHDIDTIEDYNTAIGLSENQE